MPGRGIDFHIAVDEGAQGRGLAQIRQHLDLRHQRIGLKLGRRRSLYNRVGEMQGGGGVGMGQRDLAVKTLRIGSCLLVVRQRAGRVPLRFISAAQPVLRP